MALFLTYSFDPSEDSNWILLAVWKSILYDSLTSIIYACQKFVMRLVFNFLVHNNSRTWQCSIYSYKHERSRRILVIKWAVPSADTVARNIGDHLRQLYRTKTTVRSLAFQYNYRRSSIGFKLTIDCSKVWKIDGSCGIQGSSISNYLNVEHSSMILQVPDGGSNNVVLQICITIALYPWE